MGNMTENEKETTIMYNIHRQGYLYATDCVRSC